MDLLSEAADFTEELVVQLATKRFSNPELRGALCDYQHPNGDAQPKDRNTSHDEHEHEPDQYQVAVLDTIMKHFTKGRPDYEIIIMLLAHREKLEHEYRECEEDRQHPGNGNHVNDPCGVRSWVHLEEREVIRSEKKDWRKDKRSRTDGCWYVPEEHAHKEHPWRPQDPSQDEHETKVCDELHIAIPIGRDSHKAP